MSVRLAVDAYDLPELAGHYWRVNYDLFEPPWRPVTVVLFQGVEPTATNWPMPAGELVTMRQAGPSAKSVERVARRIARRYLRMQGKGLPL